MYGTVAYESNQDRQQYTDLLALYTASVGLPAGMTDMEPYTANQFDATVLTLLAIEAAGSSTTGQRSSRRCSTSPGARAAAPRPTARSIWEMRSRPSRRGGHQLPGRFWRRGLRRPRRCRRRLPRLAGAGFRLREPHRHQLDQARDGAVCGRRGGVPRVKRVWVGASLLVAACGSGGNTATGTFTVDFPSTEAAIAVVKGTPGVQIFAYSTTVLGSGSGAAASSCEMLVEQSRENNVMVTAVATSSLLSPCDLMAGKGSLAIPYGSYAFLAVAQTSPGRICSSGVPSRRSRAPTPSSSSR